VIGLPYPGGAALDKLAYEGDAKAIPLPSPALAGDTLDFSFSGIKTATLNYLNSMAQKGEAINTADVAAAYTDKIVKAIVQKAELALEKSGMKTLVLAGGVAANSHLRASLEKMCKKKGIQLCMPDRSLCGDNAAMIAAAGYYAYRKGVFADTSLNASAADDGL
jgi:N6-L-threonylcarbamoyladenine synthase